jgi:hypothetical protein
VSWKGDHPAMSPQSCRSDVQRLFSLLLGVGCVSVPTSGLGWDSNLLRCFFYSFIDDLTYVRDVKVRMEGMICYAPGSVCYGSEDFWLCSLHDCYVGLAGTSPELYSITVDEMRHLICETFDNQRAGDR